MFGIKERCYVCQKEIQPNEEIWMRMKYPSKRGMTEIKAFLHKEAQFVCMDCFEKTKK
ncbi:Fe3+ hydroxamate ABC transporter substrate-binding protein [Priestia megaterium]|uniref:Fe3+ hydroxamate ABC transporter substrate-binding protein n=1 Tax=Priestia megaterium TaxID=1404 RepID=UPI0023633958|nr:Fe3+ hydroxamate ABC transporter substrate-binding protein [Priestia megaterium]MDD1512905.1 Fe3+ hydroxamate ABC transporter substrate-binding protein [Priestia megaterium]